MSAHCANEEILRMSWNEGESGNELISSLVDDGAVDWIRTAWLEWQRRWNRDVVVGIANLTLYLHDLFPLDVP